MTSNGEQGVALFNDGALVFRLESAPLFQITWIRGPRMNNVCRALAQTSVSAANTLHPSMLAARLSFTLCSRPTPSKHITKAEITFGNMILQPLPYNARPHRAYAYTNTSVTSHFSTTVSSLLLWSLPSLCQWVYWRHHPQSQRNFDSTPANVLLAIATSDLAVRG